MLLVTDYWLLVNIHWLLDIGLLAIGIVDDIKLLSTVYRLYAIGYGLPTFGYWLLATLHYNTGYVHPGYRLERHDKITYAIVSFIGLPTADPYF